MTSGGMYALVVDIRHIRHNGNRAAEQNNSCHKIALTNDNSNLLGEFCSNIHCHQLRHKLGLTLAPRCFKNIHKVCPILK